MPACNLDSDHDRDGTGRPDRSLESGRVAVRTRSARVRDRLCGGHAITVVTVGASTTGTATRSSRRCARADSGNGKLKGRFEDAAMFDAIAAVLDAHAL